MTDGEDTVAKLDAVLAPRMQRAIETFDAGMNFILGAIGERLQAAAGKASEFAKNVKSEISSGMGRVLDSVKPPPTPGGQKIEKPLTARQRAHGLNAGETHREPDPGLPLNEKEKSQFEQIAANYNKSTAKYGPSTPKAAMSEFDVKPLGAGENLVPNPTPNNNAQRQSDYVLGA